MKPWSPAKLDAYGGPGAEAEIARSQGWTLITAQIAGNEVVYSIVLDDVQNPLSRQEVESRFASELSKK
jgi:hypothetical protein